MRIAGFVLAAFIAAVCGTAGAQSPYPSKPIKLVVPFAPGDASDSLAPFIKDGRIKPLAVTSSQRLPDYPNVPTVFEAGYPELGVFVWTAVVAPAGLPPAITARLEAELAKAQKSPELQKVFTGRGYEMYPNSSVQLTELMRTGIPRWTAVTKSSGAKAE